MLPFLLRYIQLWLKLAHDRLDPTKYPIIHVRAARNFYPNRTIIKIIFLVIFTQRFNVAFTETGRRNASQGRPKPPYLSFVLLGVYVQPSFEIYTINAKNSL